jgi:hypothetical protein
MFARAINLCNHEGAAYMYVCSYDEILAINTRLMTKVLTTCTRIMSILTTCTDITMKWLTICTRIMRILTICARMIATCARITRILLA